MGDVEELKPKEPPPPKPEIGPTCRSCVHYNQGLARLFGECRRDSPRVYSLADQLVSGFPEVEADVVWCGHHPERLARTSLKMALMMRQMQGAVSPIVVPK